MTLTDIAAIGSVLSSLAVCGSLIYLALQVRQADRNQRTLLQQGTSERNAQSVSKFTEPHLAELYVRALEGDENFTSSQAIQLAMALRAGLLGFQDQYLLHKLSMIDAMQHESQVRAYKNLLAIPAFRALWNSTRFSYAPEFISYIDALLKDVPLATPVDRGAQLKADIAALKAARAE